MLAQRDIKINLTGRIKCQKINAYLEREGGTVCVTRDRGRGETQYGGAWPLVVSFVDILFWYFYSLASVLDKKIFGINNENSNS